MSTAARWRDWRSIVRVSLALSAVGLWVLGGQPSTAAAAGETEVRAAQDGGSTYFCAGPTASELAPFFAAGPTASELAPYFRAGPTASELASFFKAGPTAGGLDACRRL